MGHLAYVGLGANLSSPIGKPEETILAAVRDLRPAGSLIACSSLYRTAPVGMEEQPRFVNAAVQMETELAPEALLDFLLAVERSYGRDRQRQLPKGPRTLDLDLLLMDDLVVRGPRLVLPHPELAVRRFVLAPLSEIAPDLRHPVLQATMRELLAALPEKGPNHSGAVEKMRSEPAQL